MTTPSHRLVLALALAAGSLTGCAEGTSTDASEGALDSSAAPLHLTEAEAAGVLLVANDCAQDLDSLRGVVGLSTAPASAIVEARDGRDRKCGTRDDRRFATLAALDAVPGVGDASVRRLLQYALAEGLVSASGGAVGSFDGVLFTAAEATGTLALANAATADHLDRVVGLDGRAVTGIFAARPFRTDDVAAGLLALSAVPYVGATALEALKRAGAGLQGQPTAPLVCQDLGGVFSGIDFAPVLAHDALDLLSRGTPADLQAVEGVGPTLADRLVAARPLRTLTDVDAVRGVGATILKALRDSVEAGWCQTSEARCGCGTLDAGADVSGGNGDAAPTGAITLEDVTFEPALVPIALDLLNRADREQLLGDGHIQLADAGIVTSHRPYPTLLSYANVPGVSTAALTLVRQYAASGLWSGPGPVRSAVTVADLVRHPDQFPLETTVSFERAVVRRINATTTYVLFALADDDRADSPTVSFFLGLCGHDSCWAPPDYKVGDAVRMVSADVSRIDGRGRPMLNARPNTLLIKLP